jgi:hypothetical protein
MARAKAMVAQASSNNWAEGRKVASAARGMTLIQVGKATKATVPSKGQAQVLVRKAAKALGRPGFSREVVFRGPGIYSYSVNPENPTQFIREDATGSRILGYVIKGKFQAVKPQAASVSRASPVAPVRVRSSQK